MAAPIGPPVGMIVGPTGRVYPTDYIGQITVGNFGAGSLNAGVPPGFTLLVSSTSATKRTLTATARAGGSANAAWLRGISQGEVHPFPGWLFQNVAISAADSLVVWVLAPDPVVPLATDMLSLARNADGSLVTGGISSAFQQALGGSGTPVIVAIDAANEALVDNKAFSGSIANATADAVSQAGATTLPVGTIVRYRLAAAGNLATATDPLTYVRLVGATSGVIYASLYVGQGGGQILAGAFRIPTAEKLDIHTANADTVAHTFTASWEGWNGDSA